MALLTITGVARLMPGVIGKLVSLYSGGDSARRVVLEVIRKRIRALSRAGGISF